MKAPSWSEFDRKTSNFEKEIYNNIQEFKNNHPLLDRALEQSFSFLPAPFNTYAQTIYNTVGGSLSPEAKSSQILDYINTVKSKGESYYYSQDWEEDYITKLQALALFDKGVAFVNLGQYENAIDCFTKVTEINPRFPVAWYNIGVSLRGLGRYEEAIKYYDKALELNPNYADAWNNKGIILGAYKKSEEAIKCFDKAIEIDPSDAKTWYNKGVSLQELGRNNDAKKYFNKAQQLRK